MYASLTFLPPSNFAVFDGRYFLQYCLERAVQGNVLFQLLNLVGINGLGFYELSHMLMMKNVNNDGGKDSPISSHHCHPTFLYPKNIF